MANNITNIISIIVNPLPPTPQSSPSLSASGTSRSISEKLVSTPGFWALLAVVIVLRNVGTGEQREETCRDLPAGDDVDGRLLAVTPATPTTPATPQNPQTPTPPKRKKRRLAISKLSSGSTAVRNTLHGLKEAEKALRN
ncbi:hypothetical protein N7537_000142 [Penicillium hordei]|uniref:Uncharacterized protein n=1 Tax=Penicillium hordei TaxID=40994 RepID=A0AAD6H5S5_9EURO|nr:uncharacterized protein N7537_000142 [Penicillium hordei]KAJ5615028.1 hypothetical protein N7537_000142 [Penicillium hordei]